MNTDIHMFAGAVKMLHNLISGRYLLVSVGKEGNNMENKFVINGFNGESVTVKINVRLYAVKDFMGKDMCGLALELLSLSDKNIWEPYGTISKNFGEYIGLKNAVYIDTNNCPYSEELLEKGIAMKTHLTKSSGFCQYPLWVINPDFLNEHGGENYKKYSKEYDEYMASFE